MLPASTSGGLPAWASARSGIDHTGAMDSVPVVYLDQKDWINMARARVSRHKVQSPRELEAADALWEVVAADRVLLPLSCAHLIETARRGVEQDRIDLADAMLAGYGGWHMRHPIEVRGKELGWGLFG